jgi:hypothetical protein
MKAALVEGNRALSHLIPVKAASPFRSYVDSRGSAF